MGNYWTEQQNRMYGGTSGEEMQRIIDAANALQTQSQQPQSGVDYALLASTMTDVEPDKGIGSYLSNPAIKGMGTNLGKTAYSAISGTGMFSPFVQGAPEMMAASGIDVPLYGADIAGMNPGVFSAINPFTNMLGASGDLRNPYTSSVGSGLVMAGQLLGPVLGAAFSSIAGPLGMAMFPLGEMIWGAFDNPHKTKQDYQKMQVYGQAHKRYSDMYKQYMDQGMSNQQAQDAVFNALKGNPNATLLAPSPFFGNGQYWGIWGPEDLRYIHEQSTNLPAANLRGEMTAQGGFTPEQIEQAVQDRYGFSMNESWRNAPNAQALVDLEKIKEANWNTQQFFDPNLYTQGAQPEQFMQPYPEWYKETNPSLDWFKTGK